MEIKCKVKKILPTTKFNRKKIITAKIRMRPSEESIAHIGIKEYIKHRKKKILIFGQRMNQYINLESEDHIIII